MGLLTRQEIESYKLISDEKGECLQSASYDLRVGDRHYLFDDSGDWRAIFLGTAEELQKANEGISDPKLVLALPSKGASRLVIPPFGSAIIQLSETIDLLTVAKAKQLLIAGRFDLKLKPIYRGLISQQATQVEPCYRGKLYCFVHNLSSREVSLRKGDTLSTIEFSHVGQCLTQDERILIINKTIVSNQEKYKESKFVFTGSGIKDIRWLYETGRLPDECGIAPIYQKVNGNLQNAVDAYLEKSDTVEKLSNRVGIKLSTRQNVLKIAVTTVVAAVGYFAANLGTEIYAELRYLREELNFLVDSRGGLSTSSLDAIQQHTTELAQSRQTIIFGSIIGVSVIVALLLSLMFCFLRPKKEEKWEHKSRELKAKTEFLKFKEDVKKKRKDTKEEKKAEKKTKKRVKKEEKKARRGRKRRKERNEPNI